MQKQLLQNLIAKVVEVLRLSFSECVPRIRPSQVRAALDMEGESKDTVGATVSASLIGPHDGTHAVLSDVSLSVSCWTHLDEDADGSQLDSLAADAADIIATGDIAPDGWRQTCRPEPVAISEASTDGSFRVRQITATIYLQELEQDADLHSRN